MVGKRNRVWSHFDRVTEYMVSCKYCGDTLTSKHSSSNLVRHLHRRHKPIAAKLEWEDAKHAKLAAPRGRRSNTVVSNCKPIEDPVKQEADLQIDNETSTGSEREPQPEPLLELQMEEELMLSRNISEYNITPGTEAAKYLTEKLKAETCYFKEMAELARAKRKIIELQTQKLQSEMNKNDTWYD